MLTAYVGLGSNLGDREERLAAAVRLLDESPAVRVARRSPIYETTPWGPITDQPDFLNAVCEITTTLAPRPLLLRLLAIEAALGRERRGSPGPRVVDLDLLLYGDRIVDETGLRVPHPRLHERAFVLAPLCDLAPDYVHPRLGVLLRVLCERVGTAGVRRAGPAPRP
jgi:2-amino-4-hydroxy-6-hydroxymethyldihydropteridine diphosphokinase